MSCFFFYFKPMGLYSGGLIHGLMFTLGTGVGLNEDGLILGWAYPWQFTVYNTQYNFSGARDSHNSLTSCESGLLLIKEYDAGPAAFS